MLTIETTERTVEYIMAASPAPDALATSSAASLQGISRDTANLKLVELAGKPLELSPEDRRT
jgi:hypothetical protein